jgi:hypothetical protein
MGPLEIILTVLTAAGGSAVVLAALAAWLGKVWADRIAQNQKLNADIDVDLRVRRIDVYQELWSCTSLLPKWPKASGVTYQQLLAFSQTLRDWYFMKGGMYLSRSTHDKAYSPLQDALAEVLKSNSSGAISDEHYERIRRACSTLRTALAGDIESRREGPE